MSGREFDLDGTDSYHPEHPWEQAGDPLYIAPGLRTRANWPPVPAMPAGPHEAKIWRQLPKRAPKPPKWRKTFGPGFTSDAPAPSPQTHEQEQP